MNKHILVKIIAFGLISCLVFALCSCGSGSGEKLTGKIKAVAREEGSGTGETFSETTGVIESGNNNISDKVKTVDSGSAVIKAVSSETNAIGYVSLGAAGDDVKVLKVDGYEAIADNINSGTYPLQRNFNFVTSGKLSDAGQDFINFVLSKDGQKIIEDEGYIPINDIDKKYSGKKVSGTLKITGSTSAAPVIEVLAEEYSSLNDKVKIKVKKSNSGDGVQSVIDGSCDIGIASRDLEAEEMKAGITSQVIAVDGIAVAVNKGNAINNISLETLKKIYTGEITKWSQIK